MSRHAIRDWTPGVGSYSACGEQLCPICNCFVGCYNTSLAYTCYATERSMYGDTAAVRMTSLKTK